MLLFLIIVPLLATLTTLFLYKHNGKKELLRLDLVQFAYGFIIFPLMFVWLKAFLFYLLSKELEIRLTVGQLFMIDTFFSVVMLFVFGFEIIHILTKTFSLKYYRDPLYDIFEHSEYYHVWLSHVGMTLGLMLIIMLLAIMNVFFPFDVVSSKVQFYPLLVTGLFSGAVGFFTIWLSDPQEAQYLRSMKLAIGAIFLILVVVYFAFDPRFSLVYGWYWFALMMFFTGVVCSFMFERSKKAKSLLDWLKHSEWEKKKFGKWNHQRT